MTRRKEFPKWIDEYLVSKKTDWEFKIRGSHSFEDQQVQVYSFLRTNNREEGKDIAASLQVYDYWVSD